MPAVARLAASASWPNWGVRRERGMVRTSTSCAMSCARRRAINSSPGGVPGTCAPVLVPGLKPRRLLGENDPDAAGKAAPLGLDQVPDDLLSAPLAGRGVVGQHRLGQRGQLGA